MELECVSGAFRNGLGERVDVEDEVLFPLLKSSDVANGRLDAPRALLVPQRSLDGDPRDLRKRAPRAFAYLEAHRRLLSARQSAVYRGRPPYSVFGVGEYSFAPWKVAISGLYKRLSFALVGPRGGRAVVFDDTCYFLSFDSEREAKRAFSALGSPEATEFFTARVFWDDKRPIDKALLMSLDLSRLVRGKEPAGAPVARARPRTGSVTARSGRK
jgi:hypothetical protein